MAFRHKSSGVLFRPGEFLLIPGCLRIFLQNDLAIHKLT